MTRFARVLCTIYGAASIFLAYAAVQQARYGEPWAVAALSGCALVPLIALIRETDQADDAAEARADAERAERLRDRADERGMRAALDDLKNACCDRWWTSCGFHHDSTCATQRRAA